MHSIFFAIEMVTKERANKNSRTFQILNSIIYYFLICVKTTVLQSIQENI